MALGPSAQAVDVNYVLALSWQPGFCASDGGAKKAECMNAGAAQLALHGLWPNTDRNDDGRLDEDDDYCVGAGRASIVATDKRDWRQLPPVELSADLRNRLARIMPGTRSQLDRHQWVKHGSCSGLGAERYFAAAASLAESAAKTDLSALITAMSGDDILRRDLLRAFATEFGQGSDRALQLLCRRENGHAYLTEIRLRLKAGKIEAPLSAQSLDAAEPAKGNCPARFRVVGG